MLLSQPQYLRELERKHIKIDIESKRQKDFEENQQTKKWFKTLDKFNDLENYTAIGYIKKLTKINIEEKLITAEEWIKKHCKKNVLILPVGLEVTIKEPLLDNYCYVILFEDAKEAALYKMSM